MLQVIKLILCHIHCDNEMDIAYIDYLIQFPVNTLGSWMKFIVTIHHFICNEQARGL